MSQGSAPGRSAPVDATAMVRGRIRDFPISWNFRVRRLSSWSNEPCRNTHRRATNPIPRSRTRSRISPSIREAEHLEPGTRDQVADLLGNLAVELNQAEPWRTKELLAQTTTQLEEAVRDRHEPGLMDAARERMEEVVARAETKAPVTTDLVLHLIDLLANLGI